MSIFECEFWHPENISATGRACTLSENDECPYPACYESDGDESEDTYEEEI